MESFDQYSPANLATAISSCRVVVTEAHTYAAVFALGQGIPVISFAESFALPDKDGGTPGDVPRELRSVLKPSELGERLTKRSGTAVDRRSQQNRRHNLESRIAPTDCRSIPILDSYVGVDAESSRTAQPRLLNTFRLAESG